MTQPLLHKLTSKTWKTFRFLQSALLKDGSRPTLQTIKKVGKLMVTTDSHRLHVVETDEPLPEFLKFKIGTVKSGYQEVIPADDDDFSQGFPDIQQLLPTGEPKGTIFFSAGYLYDLVYNLNRDTPVQVKMYGSLRPAEFIAELPDGSKAYVLLMPMHFGRDQDQPLKERPDFSNFDDA